MSGTEIAYAATRKTVPRLVGSYPIVLRSDLFADVADEMLPEVPPTLCCYALQRYAATHFTL
eukprot:2030297-Rhodomonas_salina.2